MALTSRVVLCVFVILPGLANAAPGYCSFPAFLWTPAGVTTPYHSRNRTWISGVEYRENSDTWSKQKEILARESEIIIQHKIHVSCDDNNSGKSVTCYRQTLIYRIICIQEEPDDKFRIQKENNGHFQFSCMQFLQRSDGVVQVYSASPKDLNEDKLCYKASLHREEWPWIDPTVKSWLPCPFTGGYDFRASYLTSQNKESCSEDWIPSRIESECILGEGIIFTFPNASCNPFNMTNREQHLQCRSVWKESIYTFYLLSENASTPRYILRLPRETVSPLTGHLYLSAVTPMSGLGFPPGDVMAITMQMRRSDSGTCYDESASCMEFAQQGKCTNTAFHKFASHCIKSCGMCKLASKGSPESECFFDETIRGAWHMFDDQRSDNVTIIPQIVTFSNLGRFYCKSRHWERDFYKTLSVFSNGCRPRFTCLEIVSSTPDILHYRMSQSSLSDQSFTLCRFIDDPLPVADAVRSKGIKTLIAWFLAVVNSTRYIDDSGICKFEHKHIYGRIKHLGVGASKIRFGKCGLNLLVHINLTMSPGTHCDGTLTDMELSTCEPDDKLIVSLHSCPFFSYKEFPCVAMYRYPTSSYTAFLVINTTNLYNSYLQCFVIHMYEPRHRGIWQAELEAVHCSNHKALPYMYRSNFTGHIQKITSYADKIDHPCSTQLTNSMDVSMNSRHPPASSTSTSLTSGHTTPLSSNKHRNLSSRKRIRTQSLQSSELEPDFYIDYNSSSSASFMTWRVLMKIIYFGHLNFIICVFVYLVII